MGLVEDGSGSGVGQLHVQALVAVLVVTVDKLSTDFVEVGTINLKLR